MADAIAQEQQAAGLQPVRSTSLQPLGSSSTQSVDAINLNEDSESKKDDAPKDDNVTTVRLSVAAAHNIADKQRGSVGTRLSIQPDTQGPDKFFIISGIIIEVIILFFYAIGSNYHPALATNFTDAEIETFNRDYATYQDVHVMILIGFGFLMTFLGKYGWSAVSYNLLITAVAIQWGMFLFYWVTTGKLFDREGNNTPWIIDTVALVDGDIAAAAVLISFGAILGRSSPTQLLWLTFFELIIYSFNFYVCAELIGIIDVGGSIVVHTFGAYFGLAVSYTIRKPKTEVENKSNYNSDLFAMIGSLFLWIYWPSFNGFFAGENGYYRDRAFINTVLSLSGCTVTSFIFSKIFHNGKFDMVHIQNATLAGGVAVGASADLYLHPAGAIGVGVLGGIVSVVGYYKVSDIFQDHFRIWDTCGVHNLHGMPGVLGGIVSAIAIAVGGAAYDPSATPFGDDFDGDWGHRAALQMGGLVCTLGVACFGGLTVGKIIVKIDKYNPYRAKNEYKDNDNYVVHLEPTIQARRRRGSSVMQAF